MREIISIFKLFNMEDAQKVWYQESVEDDEERGMSQGESLKLIDLMEAFSLAQTLGLPTLEKI